MWRKLRRRKGRRKGGEEQRDSPIPKFLGADSNRGFFFACVFLLTPKGAAVGFLPVLVLALGGWSLRGVASNVQLFAQMQQKEPDAVS